MIGAPTVEDIMLDLWGVRRVRALEGLATSASSATSAASARSAASSSPAASSASSSGSSCRLAGTTAHSKVFFKIMLKINHSESHSLASSRAITFDVVKVVILKK